MRSNADDLGVSRAAKWILALTASSEVAMIAI